MALELLKGLTEEEVDVVRRCCAHQGHDVDSWYHPSFITPPPEPGRNYRMRVPPEVAEAVERWLDKVRWVGYSLDDWLPTQMK